jgi:type I restriction enzyme M protein
MDASEYKHVILGLIFLKYLSDKFEDRYKALKEEGDGFEEDRDAYDKKNVFYVPASPRWKKIAAKAHAPEIGEVIDDAMVAVEKENAKLKGVLPKNFARPELDKRRLGEVVDLFTNITMTAHGDTKDILGRTYEYCFGQFAAQEGKLAGEFYTPACVVRTLVDEKMKRLTSEFASYFGESHKLEKEIKKRPGAIGWRVEGGENSKGKI